MTTDRIILGIDPGTNIMGYGIIHNKGTKIDLIAMDVIKLNNIEDPFSKLKIIFHETVKIIQTYHADELAIEAPFYGKNVQSMLKLGRAQGVVIAAALSLSIPVYEYSPRKIKQSVTGKGTASKEQLAGMLQHLLQFENHSKYLDASDAVGVAVCHYFQKKGISSEKSYSGWKSFITDNPKKVIT